MDKERILVFENKDYGTIRTVMIDNAPWFVANDVCSAIDVDRTAIRRLDDDEKGVHLTHTLGGDQKISIINEYGLYSLILSSRKPEAKAFKRWITHEVIPSIRKHGAYMTTSLLEQIKENPQVIYGLAEKLLTEKNRAD